MSISCLKYRYYCSGGIGKDDSVFFYEYSTLQVNKYLTFALEMPCVFVQSIPGQLGIR